MTDESFFGRYTSLTLEAETVPWGPQLVTW